MKLRNLVMLLLLCSPLMGLHAQELEYQMEMGGGLGMAYYFGDAGSAPFAHPNMMGSYLVRRVFNPRMVLKGNLAFGRFGGNSKGHFIPVDANSGTAEGGELTQVKFNRNVVDLGAQFEFNFLGYGTGAGYKGNKRITPYAVAGVGFTLAPGGAGTKFGLNLPIGAGVKYKLKPRVNVGAEWTYRFTTIDALDIAKGYKQLDSPYGIKSAGFKNKDGYSFLMVYLTYDMCPKYRKCNN